MAETGEKPPVIVWFRQDLRIAANPALHAAARATRIIVPVFILDEKADGTWARGSASRWWLHHSLEALSKSLSGALVVRRGDATSILP